MTEKEELELRKLQAETELAERQLAEVKKPIFVGYRNCASCGGCGRISERLGNSMRRVTLNCQACEGVGRFKIYRYPEKEQSFESATAVDAFPPRVENTSVSK